MTPGAQARDEVIAVDAATDALVQRDHDPILATARLHWLDEAACRDAAAALAAQRATRDAFIELRGPLGAGKTTFVRHLLRALGVGGRIKSPTYALMEPYELPDLAVSHFDFYRFADPREWEDAGLRDAFARPGLKLVEWPEKAGGLLPRPDLRIELSPLDETRRDVTLSAFSPTGRAMLRALAATPTEAAP